MCAIINTAGQFNIISPHKIILTDKIDKTTLKNMYKENCVTVVETIVFILI